MITRISLSIDDARWPKLHLTGVREGTTGDKNVIDHSVQYDLAYIQFENDLHNMLRPAVSELVERRKQQL